MKKNKKSKKLLLFTILIIILVISTYTLTKKLKRTNINIEYTINNQKYSLEENHIFNNDFPITLSWNTNETATITLPDNTEKTINKNYNITEIGKYKIKVGKTTKHFKVTSLAFNDVATVNIQEKTLTIIDINKVESITINNSTYTKAEGNIVNSFTLPRGTYTIIIMSTNGEKLESNTISIRK